VQGEKEVFLVNYMNVYRHEELNNSLRDKLQKVTAKDSQINSCNLIKGDILFTPSSETPSDIGHSVVIFENMIDCVYSYHLMRFRPKRDINILYSHFFCNTSGVLNQLSKLATGSTRFTRSVKSYSSISVSLPIIEEQIKTQNIEKEITLELKEVEEILEEIIKLPNIETHTDNIPIINEIPPTLNTDFENKLENIIKEIKLELSKDEINESRNTIISYDIQKEIILNIIETQNNTNNFVKEIDLIRLDNKQSINNSEFQYENIINIEEEKNIIQKVI
jgi:type I restriction enzyme S subunit